MHDRGRKRAIEGLQGRRGPSGPLRGRGGHGGMIRGRHGYFLLIGIVSLFSRKKISKIAILAEVIVCAFKFRLFLKMN